MFHSMSASRAAGVASLGAVAATTLAGCVAVLLSGVPTVQTQPQIKAGTYQALVKGDRLPVAAKGTACSALGWPEYEANRPG